MSNRVRNRLLRALLAAPGCGMIGVYAWTYIKMDLQAQWSIPLWMHIWSAVSLAGLLILVGKESWPR